MPEHLRLHGWFGWARALAFVWHGPQAERHAHESGLADQLEGLFASAQNAYFEDGVHSSFSRDLLSLLDQYGTPAVEALDRVIGHTDARVAAEALRWIPYVREPRSYPSRRHLLEARLFDPSPILRGAAIAGLESLHDASAIGTLRTALDKERLPQLRENIQEALEELEEAAKKGR